MILEGFQSSQRNYLFKFSGLFSLAPSLNRINRFGSQTEENFSDAGCMEVEGGRPACLPATLSSPPSCEMSPSLAESLDSQPFRLSERSLEGCANSESEAESF